MTPITITYTNWKGVTSERSIIPRGVWFGSTEWHPEPQWLVKALDVEKGAERDFALADFGRRATPADDLRAAAVVALASVDAFMSGMPITDAQKAQSDTLARAASFASEAYRQGYDHDQATHAMLRAFLTALVDPLHTDLDYLRADPAAGTTARAALSQNGGAA